MRTLALPFPLPALAALFRRIRPEPYTARWLRSVHARMDATVPDGATVFLGDSHLMGLATAAVEPLSVNFSIGGQRTDHLIAAMSTYTCLRRAGLVVLMIGTNDLIQGRLDGFCDRLRRIIEAIPCPVLVCSPPVLADGRHTAQHGHAVHACRVAAAAPRAIFLATHEALDRPGVLDEDGIHLTPDGYRLLVSVLRPAVAALRNAPERVPHYNPEQLRRQ